MNMANDKKSSYDYFELQNLQLDFSYSEIIENLKNPACEDFVKIFSILNLNDISSLDDMLLLFSHLTNHSTPIREVVALKLEEIYLEKYYNDEIKKQFLKAIIDINPNVCRAVYNVISKSNMLKEELELDLISNIKLLLSQIELQDKALGSFFDDAVKIRKNHAKNKKLFSLYWYLECLSICKSEKFNSEVLEILKKTIKFNDYTIREKTAKILANFENLPDEIFQIAKNEQNFYVKNLVYDKIKFED